MFLASPVFEVLYGGSRGGGKTDCLLYGALRQVENPNYRALILRRTFPELREVMDRALLVFQRLGGKWVASEKRFVWPNGASIEFGYAETFADVGQYQGQEFTVIAYDEIGNLKDERVWDFLLTCIRSTDPTLVKMARCTANPGGVAHAWLKRRFISVCPPDGTPIWIGKKSRAFVQARVYDNPSLMDNDPDYVETLRNLPEVMRKQHLEGDWEVGTGLAFEKLTETSHLVPRQPVPDHAVVFAALDWGFAHHWCASVAYVYQHPTRGEVIHVIDTALGRRHTPDVIVQHARDVLASRGLHFLRLAYTVAGHDLPQNQMTARGAFGPTITEQLAAHGWFTMNADTSRVTGYQQLLMRLEHHQIEWEDTPGNRRVIACLRDMVMNPDFPNDVLKVHADPMTGEGGDDCYDMTRYLVMSRPLVSLSPVPVRTAVQQRTDRYLKAKAAPGAGLRSIAA